MDHRNIFEDFVLNEIAWRIAADVRNSVADVKHGIGLVVATTIEVAVHASGYAQKCIKPFVSVGLIFQGGVDSERHAYPT